MSVVCCSPYTIHRLLLQMNQPTEAAKVPLPRGKKVRQQLDLWWQKIEPNVFWVKNGNIFPEQRHEGLADTESPRHKEVGDEPWQLPESDWQQQDTVCGDRDSDRASCDLDWD